MDNPGSIEPVSSPPRVDSLALVVPAYNEAGCVRRTVEEARAALAPIVSDFFEVIVVDDGSTDDTWSEISRLVDDVSEVRAERHGSNQGLGAALWTGVEAAKAKHILWIPSDGQFDPQSLLDMIRAYETADAVILMRDSVSRSTFRKLITQCLYFIAGPLVGFRTRGYSGVFLISQETAAKIPFRASTGIQTFVVLVCCEKMGLQIAHVPTKLRERFAGESKVTNLRTMLISLWEMVKIRFSV